MLMSDFKVQRGRVDIAPDTATTTLTAGVDYEAPADASRAFFRLVGIHYTGAGSHSSDFAGATGRYTLAIDNPQNILTSLDISMYEATVDLKSFDWEIIEYVGVVGGANEMIVRHVEHVDVFTPTGGAAGQADSSSLVGVTDPSKLALFVTGQRQETVGSRQSSADFLHVLEYIEATQTVSIVKGLSSFWSSSVSFAAVEFVGTNWTVQRIDQPILAAGLTTAAITSVGDVSKAFTHVQQLIGVDNAGPRDVGYELWLSDPDTISIDKNVLRTPHNIIVWVISNPEMSVQRLTGTRIDNSGTDPHILPITISAVEPSASSIWGEGGNSNENGDTHRGIATFTITDPTTVSLLTGRDAFTLDWQFEVVQWPASGATPPATFSLLSVDLDNSIAPGQMSVSILCENAGTIAGTVDIDGVLQNVSSWADGEIILSAIDADALQSGSHTLRVKKGVAP